MEFAKEIAQTIFRLVKMVERKMTNNQNLEISSKLVSTLW